MELSQIYSELNDIEELLSKENQVWTKLIEEGALSSGVGSDLFKLVDMHEKLGNDLKNEIDENLPSEATNTLLEVRELHEEIQYKKVYQNEKISGSVKQDIREYEERLDSLSKDLIKRLAKESKEFKQEVEKRPTITFNKSVLSELERKALEVQVNQGLEFPALLYYERTESGLRIYDFENIPQEYIEDSTEGSISFTQEFERYAESHINRKWIFFHTHPNRNAPKGKSSFDLSSNDKNTRDNYGLGIFVVGTALERIKDEATRAMAFWATTALKRTGRNSINTEYLPIKIKDGEKDVTDNFKLIKKYNDKIPETVANSKNPYGLIFQGN